MPDFPLLLCLSSGCVTESAGRRDSVEELAAVVAALRAKVGLDKLEAQLALRQQERDRYHTHTHIYVYKYIYHASFVLDTSFSCLCEPPALLVWDGVV